MKTSMHEIKQTVRAFYGGMSKRQIARLTGLSGHQVLGNYEDDAWNPSSDTLEKLLAPIPEGWRRKAS